MFCRSELEARSSVEGLRGGCAGEAGAKEDVLGPDGIPVDVGKVVGRRTWDSREML